MKVNEVPQDDANIFEGKIPDLQYALDENGNYTTLQSLGWEPKNDVLLHAWEVENEKIIQAKKLVEAGEKSPIYFHMIKNLMDVKLLAAYSGFWVFTVKRHFKPTVFNSLPPKAINKYLTAFGMSSKDELYKIDIEM